MSAITRKTIADTYRRIRGFVRKTPVIDVSLPAADAPVTLKLELLQHSGSFKARGAFASLLGADVPAAGVAAASGGNHGAAVAYAAHRLGIRAHIFVPETAPRAKIDKIRSYGAEVIAKGGKYTDALGECERFIADTGALPVHAYDAEPTLNGQGTLALELEEQAGDLDTLLVAVGGGGLIGGIATWCEGNVKVVAVEPESCPTLHASLKTGRRDTITPTGIASDSLGASSPGELMFPIAQRVIGEAILVSDDDIRTAQRWLWDNVRLVSEPGGAAALAALLCGHYKPSTRERIGVVVCGGNTDLELFAATVSSASVIA